jgi:preprotein translocase subunit Sss1
MSSHATVERLIHEAKALSFDERKRIIRAIEKPSASEYSEVRRKAVQTRWARRNEGRAA